jgi:hypothetical protein
MIMLNIMKNKLYSLTEDFNLNNFKMSKFKNFAWKLCSNVKHAWGVFQGALGWGNGVSREESFWGNLFIKCSIMFSLV